MKKTGKSLPFLASFFLSLLSWAYILVSTIGFCFLSAVMLVPVLKLLKKRSDALGHQVSVWWGKLILKLIPAWRLEVDGSEHVQPGQTYVVVSNHQSMLDIMVALAGLPMPFKFMAKKELFSIPLFGWQLHSSGYIPIDRGSRESGAGATQTAKEWIRKKESILLFPEGTRSLNGQIHTFKPGAFKIAASENVPILPVVMDGTSEVIPKHSWMIEKPSSLKLSIGSPVVLRDEQDLKAQIETIRADMIRRLNGLRNAQ